MAALRLWAAYAALRGEESGNSKTVKLMILHRYNVIEETHCIRFRLDQWLGEELYREWICRATDHFDKRAKDSGKTLREMIIGEQILKTVPEELSLWLRERKRTPTSVRWLMTTLKQRKKEKRYTSQGSLVHQPCQEKSSHGRPLLKSTLVRQIVGDWHHVIKGRSSVSKYVDSGAPDVQLKREQTRRER